jgi:hypothetical protein
MDAIQKLLERFEYFFTYTINNYYVDRVYYKVGDKTIEICMDQDTNDTIRFHIKNLSIGKIKKEDMAICLIALITEAKDWYLTPEDFIRANHPDSEPSQKVRFKNSPNC